MLKIFASGWPFQDFFAHFEYAFMACVLDGRIQKVMRILGQSGTNGGFQRRKIAHVFDGKRKIPGTHGPLGIPRHGQPIQTRLQSSPLLPRVRHICVFLIHPVNHRIMACKMYFVRKIIQVIGIQFKPYRNPVFQAALHVFPRFFDRTCFLDAMSQIQPGCNPRRQSVRFDPSPIKGKSMFFESQ